MANIPCPIDIKCGAPDFPLLNFSSEAPDPFRFTGTGYPIINPDNPIGTDPTGRDPSDPSIWFGDGCLSLCFSVVSQEAADLCAAAQAYICSHTGGGNGGGPHQSIFFNQTAVCSVSCPGGGQFTWVILAGTYVSTSQALADRVASEAACAQANSKFFCLGPLNGKACYQIPYSQSVAISGPNPGPIDVTITSGSLPPGIVISQSPNNGKTVFFNGTPTNFGDYTFTLQAVDPNGNTMTKTYTITVLGISNIASLPQPNLGSAYSEQLIAAGGTSPYSFGVVDGALPTGLTLSNSGLISGTSTEIGTFFATIQVSDSSGIGCVADLTLTVVNNCPGPDWTTMNWDTAVANPGIGTASITASGNTVTAESAGDPTSFGGPGQTVVLHGSLLYTGPAAACKVTISVWDNNTGADPGDFNGFEIIQDGITVLVTDNLTVIGVLTFNLLAGVNSVIEVQGRFATVLLQTNDADLGFALPSTQAHVTFQLANNCP